MDKNLSVVSSSKTASPKSDEQQLADLLVQVSALVESGQIVDWEQLKIQHPQYAKDITEIRPAMDALKNFKFIGDAAGQTGTSHLGIDGSRTLGDFRILREIGRGGMGVVYAAQQISINRQVALKILPLAELIDQRALARFKNEVTAIATLEHPHIVSVYSIGEERGIHYYAMQLVHGQSLAVVIRQLQARSRNNESVTAEAIDQVVSDLHVEHGESPAVTSTPSPEPDKLDETVGETVARGGTGTVQITDPQYFRNIVRLTLQAADALQHAHEHGIVHRDVKPGNLLLDKSGKLIITDFGLARIEAVAGVTMTGDVIGTLRYMSPEQVLAGRVLVDHRTDVYSLGATLYELMTLHPIWSGYDRAELIRKISFDEPIQPQKINPAIPTDLETVILKAIAKNPVDRYESAKAFAGDLQRFLDHKPVEAKRPTIVQRINKWTRRNPTAMWAAVCVLLVMATASAISTVMVASAYRDVSKAQADETKALEYAETKSDLARNVVDDFYTTVAVKWLDSKEELSIVQRQILVKARDLYQLFADERADDNKNKYEVAKLLLMIGAIEERLTNYESALSSYAEATEIVNELVTSNPNDPEFLGFRDQILVRTGIVLRCLGRLEAAETALGAVKKNQESQQIESDGSPTVFDFNAIVSAYTAASYQLDLEDAVERLLEAELKLQNMRQQMSIEQTEILKEKTGSSQPFLQLMVEIIGTLGEKMFEQEKITESISYFRESIDLTDALLKDTSNDPQLLETSALNHFQLGLALRFGNRRVEAFISQEKAIEILSRTMRELLSDPEQQTFRPEFPELLAWSLYETTNLLVAMDEPSLAKEKFHELFDAVNNFSQQYPAKAGFDGPPLLWPRFVAECRTKYGLFLMENERFDAAGEQFRLAIESKPDFSEAHYMIARIQQEIGELSESDDAYRKVTGFATQSILMSPWGLDQLSPGGWGYLERRFLLSAAYARLEQWDKAEQWYEEATKIMSAYPFPSQANPFWQQEAESLLDLK